MRRQRTSSWRRFDPDALTSATPTAVPVPAPARVPVVSGPCRILGLDPGSLRTGFGIIDCDGSIQRHVASGCIRPPTGVSMAQRLRFIYDAVAALVSEHRPAEVAIERVFMHRNPDSALKLGQARGVAMCAAVLGGALVFEYAPRAVKLALVGHGAAEKDQVQHMVCAILAIAGPQSLDASDALALGLCHGQTRASLLLHEIAGS
jgi:crossover junction endodeoxyribonuclease RuvC